MSCAACGSSNRDGRVYCGRCGNAVAARCQRCAFVNELDCSFCGGCACELAGSASDQVDTASSEVRILALEQVNELLRTPSAKEDPLAGPRRLTTQEDVDRLFGSGR